MALGCAGNEGMKMTRFRIAEASDRRAAQIGAQIQGCETLDDVVMSLQFESSPFRDWLIYKGGNHVAVHRFSGALRTAIITQA